MDLADELCHVVARGGGAFGESVGPAQSGFSVAFPVEGVDEHCFDNEIDR